MSQHVGMAVALGKRGRKFLAGLGYIVIMLSLLLGATPSLWAQSAGDGKDDPFYGQKGQYGATDVSQLLADSTQAVFQQVQESVAPFTGNLSLVQTDLVLPGNGGMDLKVQRVYNSRIWGRRDTSNPGVVAYNERSIAGLGWSFHFGRVRNPFGSGSQNPTVGDNPVIELSISKGVGMDFPGFNGHLRVLVRTGGRTHGESMEIAACPIEVHLHQSPSARV